MMERTVVPRQSKFGIVTRLIGIAILLGIPLIMFSPELFPNSKLRYAGDTPFLEFMGNIPLDVVSLKARFILTLITELKFSVVVYGLFCMAHLFDLFARKCWFIPEFSKLLRRFGISLLVYIFSTIVFMVLYSFIVILEIFYNISAYKPEYFDRKFEFYFSFESFLVILLAVMLIYLSKVLAAASENSDELKFIV
jgi:hypothetical protein